MTHSRLSSLRFQPLKHGNCLNLMDRFLKNVHDVARCTVSKHVESAIEDERAVLIICEDIATAGEMCMNSHCEERNKKK